MDGNEIIRLAVEIEKLIRDLSGEGETIGEQINSLAGGFSPKLNNCLRTVRRARNEYAHNYSMPIPQDEYFELSNFCIRELQSLVIVNNKKEHLASFTVTDTTDGEKRRAKYEVSERRAGIGHKHLLKLLEAHRRDQRLSRMRALRQSQLDDVKTSELIDDIVKLAKASVVANPAPQNDGFFRGFAYSLSKKLKEKFPNTVKEAIIRAIDRR